MNPYEWVQLPTELIKRDRVLHRFAPADLGRSVAALKLYLVIAGHVAHPRWGKDDDHHLGLSYTQLCDWASVSRSMIGPSLAKLPDLVSVRRGKGQSTNRYGLVGFPLPQGVGWAKLPIAHLLKSGNTMATLSARSRIDLAALKLYILLVTFRDNKSGLSRLSYERIRDYSGIGRSDITKAISCLVGLDLIAVRSGRDGFLQDPLSAQGHNIYRVHGLSVPGNVELPDTEGLAR